MYEKSNYLRDGHSAADVCARLTHVLLHRAVIYPNGDNAARVQCEVKAKPDVQNF